MHTRTKNYGMRKSFSNLFKIPKFKQNIPNLPAKCSFLPVTNSISPVLLKSLSSRREPHGRGAYSSTFDIDLIHCRLKAIPYRDHGCNKVTQNCYKNKLLFRYTLELKMIIFCSCNNNMIFEFLYILW